MTNKVLLALLRSAHQGLEAAIMALEALEEQRADDAPCDHQNQTRKSLGGPIFCADCGEPLEEN